MKHVLAGLVLLSPLTAAAASLSHTHSLQAGAVIITYLLGCSWVFWRHQKKNLQAQALLSAASAHRDADRILVTYASQSGHAEHLAHKTAASLTGAGLSIEVRPLSTVDLALLQQIRRVLFVVSTTGEGDAPDNAVDFQRHVLSHPANLSALQYGVLALGDASYTFFCGFGYTLDAWLQHAQATPLFDMVTVDQLDDGALRHWQYQLGLLAHDSEMVDWETPSYQPWQLRARTALNPGSAGAPVYHVQLTAADKYMQWQVGDIAEIGPRNADAAIADCLQRLQLKGTTPVGAPQIPLQQALQDKLLPHDEAGYQRVASLDAEGLLAALKTLPHREYSIASIPQDGRLELLIRQTRYADGRLGIGSGWLTMHAAIGSEIALRIRENSAFHPPAPDVPMILIGNGTGIAGLRAHLRHRAQTQTTGTLAATRRHWLIFGERNARHDFHFRQELESWQAQGLLTRLDVAFSRDQAERHYVQDMVRTVAAEMTQWVADGAAIYVCGSATGMAPAVHHVLLEALGEATLSALTASGRYRRDVY